MEVVLRWLAWQSALEKGDNFILGGSQASHAEKFAAIIQKGKLDEAIVSEVDGLYRAVQRSGG